MMAILSGTQEDYEWTLRPPTEQEINVYFVKSIFKEKALPFLEGQW